MVPPSVRLPRYRRFVATRPLPLAALGMMGLVLMAGCGGASEENRVDTRVSERAGFTVSGCEPTGTAHGRTFYLCDRDISAAIDANGEAYLISQTHFDGMAH
jgi:hypothetical protein